MKNKLNYQTIVYFISFLFCQFSTFAQDPGSTSIYGGGLSVKIIDTGTLSADGAETLFIGSGDHIINGVWEIYAKHIIIDSAAKISGIGTIYIYNPELAGAPSASTLIDANNIANPINVKIDLRSAKGLVLKNQSFPADMISFGWSNNNTSSSIYVGKELDLGADSAFVFLDSVVNGDLKFDNDAILSNFRPNRFVVTNNSIKSHLIKENFTSDFIFPVGIRAFDYTPAKVSNSSIQTVSVSVQNFDSSLSTESNLDVSLCGVAGNGMQRSWHIYGNGSGINSTIYLQHNNSTNQSGFNALSHYITQFGNSTPNTSGDSASTNIISAWQINTASAGATGDLSSTGSVSSSTVMSRSYKLETSSLSNLSYFSKASRGLTTKPLPPTFSSSNVCQGSPLSLAGISKFLTADTLIWYTTATGGTGTATIPTIPLTAATGSTTFYLSERNGLNCESVRLPYTITVNPTPSVPVLSPDTISYCQNETALVLTAVKGLSSDTLLWTSSFSSSPSTTAPTPRTDLSGTYVYSVVSKNSFSCQSAKDSIITIINPEPAKPIVSSPVYYCQNIVASTLSAVGTNLKWYNDSSSITTIPAPKPSTKDTGSVYYYVSQSSSFGCESKKAQVKVQIQPLPYIKIKPISPSGLVICRNSSIFLSADKSSPTGSLPLSGLKWYLNGTPVAALLSKDTVLVDTPGVWSVEVANVFGCKSKDEVAVVRDKSSVPVLAPTEISICKGNSELLTCSPGFVSFKFDWLKNGTLLTGSSFSGNIVSANDTGNYTVIVTSDIGCKDTTNQARVLFYDDPLKPFVSITGKVLSVPNKYIYYQWYRNGVKIFAANSFNYTYTSKGLYHVEVTDKNGCIVNSDTVNLNGTGIFEQQTELSAIKIYPNPSNGLIHISAPVALDISVSDISGKKILEGKNITELNLADYADGIYFLRIFNTEGQLIGVERVLKASKGQ